MSAKPIIAVAFYSTYGHIDALAEEVIKGAESTGAIVKPYVIKETLPQDVLEKMYANTSLQSKYPAIKPEDLKEIDGLILGAPTRYGRLPNQVDAFFDQTGALWAAGALVGKFVTMFTAAAGQHSGHETTYETTFPLFSHHGLAYVPIGYSNPLIGNLEEVQGGSPYGVSTVAGPDGRLQPTKNDLEVAQHQGKYFANFVGTFVRGKHAASTNAPSAVPSSVASKVPSTTEASSATTAPAAASIALAPPIEVPHSTSTSSKVAGEPTSANGYSVDKEVTKPSEGSTPATTTAQTSGETTPVTNATAGKPVPKDTTAEKPVTNATSSAEKPTAAATKATTPAPAKTAEKPKKKGFFSCCGDSGIDK